MNFPDLLNHLINFVAPALVVGFVCALTGRLLLRKNAGVPAWWTLGAINAVVGSCVLVGGLLVFGRDGRMLTYAALVVACGTSQWLGSGGWRR